MGEKWVKNGGKDVPFFLNNCPFSEKCILFFGKNVLFFCFIKMCGWGIKRGERKVVKLVKVVKVVKV